MIRIGISGWIYPAWRGRFYPAGLPHRQELAYASRAFDAIEVNGTFYSLKSPAVFRRWRDETPEGFVFALKGSRYITHMKKLEDTESALANFFAQGVLALGPKLGPILWQLPPWHRFEEERLERFVARLPRDTEKAAALARKRDRRIMSGRELLEPEGRWPIRHALEVRHESFRVPRFVTLLRRAGVAVVVADSPRWPRFEDVTADFIYTRLHGAAELYASGYDEPALDLWAERVRRWAAGRESEKVQRVGPPARARRSRDAYIFFDNDAKVRAPVDARRLAQRLGLSTEFNHPRGQNTG